MKPYLSLAFNGAYYVEHDANDPLPDPGTYTVTATQLDRIGDRVKLDFGDGRNIKVLRTYGM